MASKHLWATKLTANDSSAKEQLGIKRTEYDSTDETWKVYRYVQFNDGTAAGGAGAKGDVVSWLTASTNKGYVVTPDESDGGQELFAGVLIGALTDLYYGWVQCGGFCNYIATDEGVSANDMLIVDTTDGIADTFSAGEEHYIFGVALADDSDAVLTSAIIFDR